jgi:hypothetical protein
VDVRNSVVEVGQRVRGVGDHLVEIIRRDGHVVAGVFEFGAELVERDARLDQLGLNVAQGLAFHPFGGAGM